MGRPPEAQHQVIGDVDQRADRALPGRDQPALHPFGGGAVADAPDHPAIEGRAPFGIVGANLHRTGELTRHRLGAIGVERAQPGRSEVARYAFHPHAIGPVGGDRHLDDRAGAAILGEGGADRRIAGQLDDPVMLLAQLQLADRAHHAVALDAADRALAQRHAIGRHHRAGQAQHALDPGAGVGRAAHHLHRRTAVHIRAGDDAQHLQLVGIGMRRGAHHLGDAEARQPLGRIVDPLDLQPDRVQRRGDLGQCGLGVEEGAQPFDRNLHARAPTPAESVGWSKAEKP